jgi:hypothetical protein
MRNTDTQNTILYVGHQDSFSTGWDDAEFAHTYTWNTLSLDWAEYLDRVIAVRQ